MIPEGDEAHRAARLRRLGSNALSLLGAYVLPRVFTAGAVVVAARVLGAHRFGAYGTAAAFAVILSILATLGMHPLIVRDLARAPLRAPALLRATHQLKTVSNVVMLALLYVLARWVVGLTGDTMTAAVLLGVSYAIGAYSENLSAYFQAVERMHIWTEASALLGLVTGALGVALVLATRSLAWFAVAPVAGQAAALAWLLLRAPPAVRRGAPATREDLTRLSVALAPFAGGFVALTLHYKLDVLLMQHWRSDADVGLYTAAYKFIDLFQALVIVGVGAVFPWLARTADASSASGRSGWAGSRSAEIALLCAVPVAGALHLASVGLIRLAFGPQYAAGAPVLAWLALATPALALNLLGGYLLGAAHRMERMALLYVGALAFKTALDAVLIPRFGAVGAAAAMAVAETVLAAAMLGSLFSLTGAGLRSRPVLGAAGAAALLLPARLASDMGAGAMAAVLYIAAVAGLYIAFGVVHPGQRRVIGLAIRGGTVAARTS